MISKKRSFSDHEEEETVFDAINRVNKYRSTTQAGETKEPKVKQIQKNKGRIKDSSAAVTWNPPYIFATDPIDLSKHKLTEDEKLWIGKQLGNNVITLKALSDRFNLSLNQVNRISAEITRNLEKKETPVDEIEWVGAIPFEASNEQAGEYDLRGKNISYDEKLWLVNQLNARIVTCSAMSQLFHLSMSTIASFKKTVNKGGHKTDPGDTLENIKWTSPVPFHQPLEEKYGFDALGEPQIEWIAQQIKEGKTSKNKLSKLLHMHKKVVDRCITASESRDEAS
jgi:hypothetical protein